MIKIFTIVALLSSGATAVLAQEMSGHKKMEMPFAAVDVAQELNVGIAGVSLEINASDGAYIEGVLLADDQAFDVFLETVSGDRFRKLLSNVMGRQVFRAVIEGEASHLRIVPTKGSGTAIVTITRNIALRDQLESVGVRENTAPQSPRLQKIVLATVSDHAVSRFWDERRRLGSPLIEPDPEGDATMRLLTFLWRGAKHNVRLVGGPANNHTWLERLGDSDIWFTSFRVSEQLRLSYRLAPDIPLVPGSERQQRVALLATLQADPLNVNLFPDGESDRFLRKSLVELPNAPQQPGILPGGAKRGQVVEARFESKLLASHRRLWLYTPAGFRPEDPDNMLLFVFDGLQYQTQIPTPKILDNLQREGRLGPVAAVFIDSVDNGRRGQELPCNADFQAMMAEELLPYAQDYFGLKAPAARTVVAGSSYGGLASACLALTRPKSFGNFISLSGSFWWSPEGFDHDKGAFILSLLDGAASNKVRAFISAGEYETSRGVGDLGIIETSKNLVQAMRARNFPKVIWRQYSGGHDYAVWRGGLAEGLIGLLGTQANIPNDK